MPKNPAVKRAREEEGHHDNSSSEEDDSFQDNEASSSCKSALYPSFNQYMQSIFELGCDDMKADNKESMSLFSPVDLSDVIVRTSTKDFHLHRLMLYRSSFFRTLLNSEHWNQHAEMENGKMVADLRQVEKNINTANGETISEEIFCDVFRYLYTDSVYCYIPCRLKESKEDQEKSINSILDQVHLARYFDLKQMEEQILSKLTGTFKLYIPFQLEIPISESAIIDFAFELCKRHNNEDLSAVTMNFVEFIAKQKIIPLQQKLVLVKRHIESIHGRVKTFNAKILQPYANTIEYIKADYNTIMSDVTDESLHPLLVAMGIPNNETKQKFRFCQAIEGSLYASDGEGEEFSLFNEQLSLISECGERSSAYWWTFSLESSLPFQVKGTCYIKYSIGDENNTEQHTIPLNEPFTLHAAQFDSGGCYFTALFDLMKDDDDTTTSRLMKDDDDTKE
ncbi:hypothetical protein C9374_001569 [Naegleria lovaniensis]|uniref:BTB domain-containing protein n=1 Tax=Naegleria lovaniensis TaxID=51637 RepID=A0AA88KRD1_NAELO|nr:uncharacterized protein C9374_001569 [Naegleria lovaniensis]KAG2387237.1 hypothetical protein C9374_001569 [Naegleria lovaniensis]